MCFIPETVTIPASWLDWVLGLEVPRHPGPSHNDLRTCALHWRLAADAWPSDWGHLCESNEEVASLLRNYWRTFQTENHVRQAFNSSRDKKYLVRRFGNSTRRKNLSCQHLPVLCAVLMWMVILTDGQKGLCSSQSEPAAETGHSQAWLLSHIRKISQA